MPSASGGGQSDLLDLPDVRSAAAAAAVVGVARIEALLRCPVAS